MWSLIAVSDWVLGAATVAFGVLLTTATSLLVEGIKRHWSQSDATLASHAETQRRADEQSDAAAREILTDISQVRTLYVQHPLRYEGGETTGGPGAIWLGPVLERIASLAVDLRDSEVRRRLELAVFALQNREVIRQVQGVGEWTIMRKSTDVMRNALGAMLRREALPDDARILEEYKEEVIAVFGEPGDSE